MNRRDGNYSFHSNHIQNGATGTHGDDPDAVATVHATGTHLDPDPDTGVIAPAASAQNGRDAVVTRISEAGVFEGIFAVDTMPVDGKYDDTSLNSGWGGYSWMSDLDSFAASGDNDNMVAIGLFRGKLTFPTAAGAAPVTLENPKWQKYDGFLAKFNVNTHKVVWATGDTIQMPTCNTNTDGTPMKPKNKKTGEGCDEPASVPGSVATTSEGHIIATSSYGNSGRSTTNGRIHLFNGNTGANVWTKDLGKGNFVYGTETIGTTAYVAGTIDGTEIDPFNTGEKKNYTDAPAIVAVDASAAGSGAFVWSRTFGQEGTAISIVADPDGTHLYVGGSLDQAPETSGGKHTIGSACSLTGKYGGFLMKLAAATGECVWATDTPRIGSASTRFGMRDHGLDVDANGTYIYTVKYDDDPVVFDDNHTIPNRGLNSDGFLAKYSCADGVGQWVESIGGGGRDYIREVVTTPTGVVIVGSTTSQSIELGDAKIVNLQHKRADGVGRGQGQGGQEAAEGFPAAVGGGEPVGSRLSPPTLNQASTATSTAAAAATGGVVLERGADGEPVLMDITDDAAVAVGVQPLGDITNGPPVLFWKPDDGRYGAFSNWAPSVIKFDVGDGSFPFDCGEHLFAALKAVAFGDAETLAKIKVAGRHPSEYKRLGREVRGFDERSWVQQREDVMRSVVAAKFEQNPELGRLLDGTGRAAIIEASPYDKVWGAGLSAQQILHGPSDLPGLNLLGKALMKVRRERRDDPRRQRRERFAPPSEAQQQQAMQAVVDARREAFRPAVLDLVQRFESSPAKHKVIIVGSGRPRRESMQYFVEQAGAACLALDKRSDCGGVDMSRASNQSAVRAMVEREIAAGRGGGLGAHVCQNCNTWAAALYLPQDDGPPIGPYRSEQVPEGRPDLTAAQRQRCEEANKVLTFSLELATLIHRNGGSVSFENGPSCADRATPQFVEIGEYNTAGHFSYYDMPAMREFVQASGSTLFTVARCVTTSHEADHGYRKIYGFSANPKAWARAVDLRALSAIPCTHASHRRMRGTDENGVPHSRHAEEYTGPIAKGVAQMHLGGVEGDRGAQSPSQPPPAQPPAPPPPPPPSAPGASPRRSSRLQGASSASQTQKSKTTRAGSGAAGGRAYERWLFIAPR